MKNIFIDTTNGRFANQLYPIACALSLYGKYPNEFNKPLFKVGRQPTYCLYLLKKYFSKYIDYNIENFNNEWNKSDKEGIKNNIITNDSHVRFIGYCQNNNLIDEKIIHQYMSIPDDIKETVNNLYGDLSDYICLHVRRGDYLHGGNEKLYNTLSKEYIERVINKYFPNDKIICISDDMGWCKENLSNNPNIIFGDKINETIVDFYIQTLTKGNICSGSSFSMAGVILNPNPNKIVIVPDPFFKTHTLFPEIKIIPEYAIKEPITI